MHNKQLPASKLGKNSQARSTMSSGIAFPNRATGNNFLPLVEYFEARSNLGRGHNFIKRSKKIISYADCSS